MTLLLVVGIWIVASVAVGILIGLVIRRGMVAHSAPRGRPVTAPSAGRRERPAADRRRPPPSRRGSVHV
jgi:hypothetical protein